MDFRPSPLTHIQQPFVVLQPGQMMSVVTYEEIFMPVDLCGTVYSKNGLALNGIFAFNAGHVDPGFKGPIVIRLINLRATPWTLTLGQRIFTIIFHTLEFKEGDLLEGRGAINQEETLQRVRHFTDVALSNALFDLYAQNIEDRLSQHRSDTLTYLAEKLREEFIPKAKFGAELWAWTKRNAIAIISTVGGTVALIKNFNSVVKLLTGH
jgi:dUTPase